MKIKPAILAVFALACPFSAYGETKPKPMKVYVFAGQSSYRYRPPSAVKWTPPPGHPDLVKPVIVETKSPSLAVPGKLELANDWTPENPHALRRRHLGLDGFKGAEIGKVGDVYPIYILSATMGKIKGDPFQAGDLILAVDGAGFPAVHLYHSTHHETHHGDPRARGAAHRHATGRGQTQPAVLQRRGPAARSENPCLGKRPRWREGYRGIPRSKSHHHGERRQVECASRFAQRGRSLHDDPHRRQHRHHQQSVGRRGLVVLRPIEHEPAVQQGAQCRGGSTEGELPANPHLQGADHRFRKPACGSEGNLGRLLAGNREPILRGRTKVQVPFVPTPFPAHRGIPKTYHIFLDAADASVIMTTICEVNFGPAGGPERD